MGKIDYLTISLSKKHAIYFPGEVLHGTISYRVSERLKINQLKLIAEGDTHVHWNDVSGSGRNRMTKTHKSFEKYFRFEIVILSKSTATSTSTTTNHGDNVMDLYLEVGTHSHPFQIHLPANLPTSFEHQHGRIRYWCMAKICVPWSFDRQTIKMFTVLNHLDLNNFKSLAETHSLSDSRKLCCMCCSTGPINLSLQLNKSGFVSGESIMVNIVLENESNRDLAGPKIEFFSKLRFHAGAKVKTITRLISILNLDKKVSARSTEKFNQIQIFVPQLCPTSMSMCKILEVSYFLSVRLDVSLSSIELDLHLPIVIGTIPIRDNSNVLLMPSTPSAITPHAEKEASRFTFDEPSDTDTTMTWMEKSPKSPAESHDGHFKPHYPIYKYFKPTSSS